MIPNITHSTGSGNYLGYDLGDKKEQYQRVRFLAAEGVMIDDRLIERLNQNWEDGDEDGYQAFRKVSMAIANDLDEQFQVQAALNGRRKVRAINISLSYSPQDTDKVNEVVYDETRNDDVPLRLKMGREFLDGMGFGDIQYVAVSHLGTRCAHDHYAINTIRADGSSIKLKFDFVRAQKLAAEIRQKYELTPPDESLQMIAPKAKEALKQSCSWEEYGQRLREHGIGLVYSDHSKNGRGYGVSYSFGKKVIPGSKLHRSLSYGQVDAVLAQNLAAWQAQEEASRIEAQRELERQKAEAEERLAAEKAAQEAARKAQEEAARAAEERRHAAKKIAGEPETFVIHSGMDATLYSNRPDSEKTNMLQEAARSILKYYTWGANINYKTPDEFVDSAEHGQHFGTVRFDTDKARFVGETRNDGMLENPDEVVQFIDQDGQSLNLFTPAFWTEWHRLLGTLKERLAREEAAAEVQRKELEECNEMTAGYNSIVPPIWDNLQALRSSTYHLYEEAKETGFSLSSKTTERYSELKATWKEFDELQDQSKNTEVAKDITKFIGGALVCLNPIIGFTVAFLAAIVLDIKQSSIRSQQKKLLDKVDAVRKDLATLKQKKAALTIQKQERLRQYLDVKRMYQEYQDGLKTIDNEVKTIESELRVAEDKDFIRKYVHSDLLKELLDLVNNCFDESHYNLVPGPLNEADKGMRLVLYTDGFCDPRGGSRILYHQHEPAPQDHGESYIDFSIDQNGHLVAAIECDPHNYYTYGISGKVNLGTDEGFIARRDFRGTAEQNRARKQKTQDTYARFTAAAEENKKNNPKQKKGGYSNGL